MLKELVPSQLDALTSARKSLAQIRLNRLKKDQAIFEENSKVQETEVDFEERKPIRKLRKLTAKCTLEEQLFDIPHVKAAFEGDRPHKHDGPGGQGGPGDVMTKLQFKSAEMPPNNQA